MNKEERATLRRAVERARRLLEDEVADQLEGAFGILQSGKVLDDAPGDPTVRQRLLELITHHQAGGESAKGAVERTTRELAFTTLNRFVALKMAERRGLVRECISKGLRSDGIRELADCAPGLRAALPDGGYRLLLEAVMDEVSIGLSVLFDRRAPAGLIWPRPKALGELLDILNAADLASLWEQDETIGWVYQYFNPKEEREAMRKASQAPRNSRELAVRNQFFTPRYVVAFLTDNTLGRIWYEMHKGDTALKERCRYLVRRPSEVFLAPGEAPPQAENEECELTQEELLRRPVYIEHRPRKDPRDIKVLDPACGSGHFLLYAFELLERIYEEAWADVESPASEATGRTLREDYGSIEELRRAAPKLIIEHNLHGIDIDPRAVQIAALALWLRAQRAWQGMGLKPTDRPRITRSNIVTAEPMPGEDDMRRELVDGLRPRVLGQLIDLVFERMRLAGEAGSLLRIEEEIKDGIAEARKQWLESPEGERQLLLPGMSSARAQQQRLRFDLTDVDSERFWEEAEGRILEALRAYAERVENGRAFRRRLFAEDAARGFAFIDLCRRRYDVVLMNPPFGLVPPAVFEYLQKSYEDTYVDVYGAFVVRGTVLAPHGCVGAITSRSFITSKKLERWRRNQLIGSIDVLVDLGRGVMDDALIDSAAYIVRSPRAMSRILLAVDLRRRSEPGEPLCTALDTMAETDHVYVTERGDLLDLPGSKLLYFLAGHLADLLRHANRFEPLVGTVRGGMRTFDDFRFLRLCWEVPLRESEKHWELYAKGGEYANYYTNIHLCVNRTDDGAELAEVNRRVNGQVAQSRQGSTYYYRPGCQYTGRSAKGFSARAVPAGCVMSSNAPMILTESDVSNAYILGWVNSRLIRSIIQMQAMADDFVPGIVKNLPWIDPDDETREMVERLSHDLIQLHRKPATKDETEPVFISSSGRLSDLSEAAERYCDQMTELAETICAAQRKITERIDRLYGVDSEALGNDVLERDITTEVTIEVPDEKELATRTLGYSLGVLMGRWDVRIALDPSLAPRLPDPFDPLPVCPPGMLVGPDGLPAKLGGIVSEAWLRARPDASTLPPEGTVSKPTIPDSEYPLRISWDGILVDDPGLDGAQPHRDDIVRRVREVFDLFWKDKAYEIEQEACGILGVRDLRDYFRKPSGFFQDHLKRYSKSRRKAPIYWPLSTTSGAYTVWVYYHRLTEDTLYRIVSDYLGPRISEVEDRITQREAEQRAAQGRDAARLARELSELTSLLEELRELREELLRVARLPYRPNLNDGVQITAAPLWRLFRLPRWRSELGRTWQALERGDYDWAHLAYAIWPERVREACRRDRSIAIAHGLEELCEERRAPERPARGRRRRAG